MCVFEKGMEDYVCTRNCLHSTLSWTGFDGNQATSANMELWYQVSETSNPYIQSIYIIHKSTFYT